MSLRQTTVVVLAIALIALPVIGAPKSEPTIVRLGNVPAGKLASRPFMAAADTCQVRPDLGFYWRIDGWVTGQELYKAYLNPAESCPNPYPFTVTAINMPMIFDGGTPLVVSVDVELVDDTSYPGCNFPGEVLAISSEYNLTVPAEGGLYDIWIPLDTPVVVHGPFFAGFYIDNAVDSTANAAVITDSLALQCVSWNIWDLDLGFVDLCDNGYYNFPGRLVLYAAGIPGGGGSTDPAPEIVLISPSPAATLYGSADLWADETSGSNSIDYVSFSYSAGAGFIEIGRDFDGTQPLRDGVDPALIGNGFSLDWDFSLLPEGQYTIRAKAVDTLGRWAAADVQVTLDPTPPVPQITSPQEETGFCAGLKLIMSCNDDDVSFVQIERKVAADTFSAGLVTFDQNTVGDNNGNLYDGNTAAAGEFGDYYSGPVAAALAARLWVDRGYVEIMKDPANFIDYLTMPALVEKLAAAFDTRADFGTYDENLYKGMKNYFGVLSSKFAFSFTRNPKYHDLRNWVEESERAVIVGVGGDPGFWAAVDGFKGWSQADSTYILSLSVPMTGIIEDVPFRDGGVSGEIYYAGAWHSVDIAVIMYTDLWAVNRTVTGVDFSGRDGWSVSWTPTGLTEDDHCYFRSYTQDAASHEGSWTTVLKYDCTEYHKIGDFNDDGLANISDLYYLIAFITQDGAAPEGGAQRADCNCDNVVNVADIVYYFNYLFGTADEPCY